MSRQIPLRPPRPTRAGQLQSRDNEKENVAAHPLPPDKKRKLNTTELPPVKFEGRITRRHTLGRTEVNGVSNPVPPLPSGRGSLGAQAPLFQGSQNPEEGDRLNDEDPLAGMDVEALLNQKMVGKTKYDFKGKSEQMMEYIKKLRVCIRGFQQREAALMSERGVLQHEMAHQEKSHMEAVSSVEEQLASACSSVKALTSEVADLDKRLGEARAQIVDMVAARETDAEALRLGKEAATEVRKDLEKAQELAASASQQVTSLQDINSRVQEYNTSLQQYNSQLQGEAAKAGEELRKVQREKAASLEELATLRGHVAALESQLQASKEKVQEAAKQSLVHAASAERLGAELSRAIADRDSWQAQAQMVLAENTRYRECTGKSAAELEQLSSKAMALEESFASQGELLASLRQQVEIGRHRLQLAEGLAEQKDAEIVCLKARASELEKQLVTAEERILEGEVLRRRLHNTIQELKGNIRVFCRVRPLTQEEEALGEEGASVVQFPTGEDVKDKAIDLVQAQGPTKYSFTYDKVFGPDTSQQNIFEDIEQLVQSALDGYRVCIFAYGQTGSGKTYTMLGDPANTDHRGVIPRSLEQIFKSSQELVKQGWQFNMQASMLEIYNETIRDLLGAAVPSRSSSVGVANASEWGGAASASAPGGAKPPGHAVKHDAHGNTLVTDLTLVEVASWQEVSMLLSRAAQSRSVGKTAMNERSSRSHCVFTLRIVGSNDTTEQSVNGVLNLIDLAGSERLSRSAVTGDRLKETQAINKSLSSLGDVICAIANKDAHIPYRNSKLTYLLQPCLGGDAKTLMFVNVAPTKQSMNESLCSLRFAAKVNACEIGVPRRQASQRADSGKSGSVSMC